MKLPYKDKNRRNEYTLSHKVRIAQLQKESYNRHKQERRELSRRQRRNLRIAVLTHYGEDKLACVKCGFSDYRALSIDHINGGGAQAARERNHTNIYSWLKLRGFPQGLQTLCMNCQFIKKLENKEARNGSSVE